MIRHTDWAGHFYQALHEKKYQPFQWGTTDCLLFSADMVREITGTDLAKDVRGQYDSIEGACHFLKSFAGGGVMEAIRKIALEADAPEIPPLSAQRGDVVIVETELGDTLAVCIGEGVMTVGLHGTIQLPLKDAKRAWRI